MSNLRNYLKSPIWETHFWETQFFLIFGFSLSILCSAFSIDWLMGFDPCVLCYYARIPYGVLLALSLLAFKIRARFRPYVISLMIITVLVGFGLAIYHTGVERDLWDPTTHCSPNITIGQNTTLEEFRKQLDNAKIGDCSKPAFHVLGLSLAEANIMLNFVLMVYFVMLLRWNLKGQK